MALEIGTYISDLVSANPVGSDAKSTADDHLRLMKSCIKATFPSVTGAVTKTHTELNTVTDRGLIAGQTWTGSHTFPATTYGVTASAGSNNLLLATTAYVDVAFGLMPPGTLPSITGKNTTWKLTVNADGTAVQWTQDAAVVGSGGTTLTGSVTLTVSSPASMVVTPATPGLYATLPDATTLTKGMSQFAIYNAGDYDYGVKNSAGTVLGWISSKTGGSVGLADNATATGIWNTVGASKFGVTGEKLTTDTSVVLFNPVVVALDSTRTCILFGGSPIYAVVHDSSTGLWGAPVTVNASAFSSTAVNAYQAILSATNQVLVQSADIAQTSIKTVTLTISGTGITVNSIVSTAVTLLTGFGNPLAVVSSFVFPYLDSGDSRLVAISVSGTVPTVGTSVLLKTGGVSVTAFVVGSIIRTISFTTTAITAMPVTLSSTTTLTLGTAANGVVVSSGGSNIIRRCFMGLTGNIAVTALSAGGTALFVAKLTGTVEAITKSTDVATATATDVLEISSGKYVMGLIAGTTFNAYIATDTSGTAAISAALSNTVAAAVTGIASVRTSSVEAVFLVGCSGSGENGVISFALNVSGGTPTLNSTASVYGQIADGTIATPQPSRDFLLKNSTHLSTASSSSILCSGVNSKQYLSVGVNMTKQMPVMNNQIGNTNTLLNTATSFILTSQLNVATSGYRLQRVEMAA
jgi:hypothetical protein